ncbi:caspase family protein [Alienimonas californiensis]|uniref:Caspase domain protein n=1 Tax=Alienimonas californiensis TaxID=2527989 RepID=A0A517PBJ1_9PLAN|nr:caspase family protein [Alienimonas californiensis]QDT16755.1 Caspase domain protein [Alienimonas californiensis]
MTVQKALLVGINQYRYLRDLEGCRNDVAHWKHLLTQRCGAAENKVQYLVDEAATRQNLVRWWTWLCRVPEGSHAVFFFSGHGTQVTDRSGDERDRKDELYCLHESDPSDARTYLYDDELWRLTAQFPTHSRLTVIVDSCHSGTALRAPGPPQPSAPAPVAPSDEVWSEAEGEPPFAGEVDSADPGPVLRYSPPPNPPRREIRARTTAPELRGQGDDRPQLNAFLAASQDDQEATEATIAGRRHGVFTYYLIRTLAAGGLNQPLGQVVEGVSRLIQSGGYPQVPNLLVRQPGDDRPLFA